MSWYHHVLATGQTGSSEDLVTCGPAPKSDDADLGEQGILADRDSQILEQSSSRLAADGQARAGEPVVESSGAPSVGSDHTWQPLREGPLAADWVVAEEPTDVEPEPHGDALPGEIGGGAHIRRVHPAGSGCCTVDGALPLRQ